MLKCNNLFWNVGWACLFFMIINVSIFIPGWQTEASTFDELRCSDCFTEAITILWNSMTLTSFISPSWLIQWSMGEGSYITLFSPSDVTAFHRMKYGGGLLYNLVFTSDVTAFHRMKYGGGLLYNLVFTDWRHCVSQNEVWGRAVI